MKLFKLLNSPVSIKDAKFYLVFSFFFGIMLFPVNMQTHNLTMNDIYNQALTVGFVIIAALSYGIIYILN